MSRESTTRCDLSIIAKKTIALDKKNLKDYLEGLGGANINQ